jgi:hypothetical protein
VSGLWDGDAFAGFGPADDPSGRGRDSDEISICDPRRATKQAPESHAIDLKVACRPQHRSQYGFPE